MSTQSWARGGSSGPDWAASAPSERMRSCSSSSRVSQSRTVIERMNLHIWVAVFTSCSCMQTVTVVFPSSLSYFGQVSVQAELLICGTLWMHTLCFCGTFRGMCHLDILFWKEFWLYVLIKWPSPIRGVKAESSNLAATWKPLVWR